MSSHTLKTRALTVHVVPGVGRSAVENRPSFSEEAAARGDVLLQWRPPSSMYTLPQHVRCESTRAPHAAGHIPVAAVREGATADGSSARILLRPLARGRTESGQFHLGVLPDASASQLLLQRASKRFAKGRIIQVYCDIQAV
eukprot:scaffold942_cov366-Prasinococcus_capsulatus_cf.AAC.4